jgi:hypothetical protein
MIKKNKVCCSYLFQFTQNINKSSIASHRLNNKLSIEKLELKIKSHEIESKCLIKSK